MNPIIVLATYEILKVCTGFYIYIYTIYIQYMYIYNIFISILIKRKFIAQLKINYINLG